MYCTAIILAAGRGSRMGADINKQYLKVDNKEIIAYTIEKFENCSSIKDIIIVAAEGEIDYFKENILKKYGFKKIKKVVAGGKERSNSVFNGLKAASVKTDIVVIHDGARPLIKTREIEKSILKAKEVGGCIVAVPVKDTIKQCDETGIIQNTPPRQTLWSAQTPQTFKYNLIVEAYQKLDNYNVSITDDSSLFELLGYPVQVIKGEYDNIKITTKEDLILFKTLKP